MIDFVKLVKDIDRMIELEDKEGNSELGYRLLDEFNVNYGYCITYDYEYDNHISTLVEIKHTIEICLKEMKE